LIAEIAGDDDERQFGLERLDLSQRPLRVETGQVVIADDHIPGLGAQRRVEIGGGHHLPVLELESAATQRIQRQQQIIITVFDD